MSDTNFCQCGPEITDYSNDGNHRICAVCNKRYDKERTKRTIDDYCKGEVARAPGRDLLPEWQIHLHHLFLVKWNDAAYYDAWEFADGLKVGVREIETVGFLVAQDEDSITLASTREKNQKSSCNMMSIPKACIESATRIGKE